MASLGSWLAGLVGATVFALLALRLRDLALDMVAKSGLRALQPVDPAGFDPATVADLPGPARRYFLHTIAPGTPLWTVASIRMTGTLALGSKAVPSRRPMQALQILAPPDGFIWQVRAGLVSGTDAATPRGSYSRFRLLGIIPVGRAGGTLDHERSAFGRCVAEAVFWAPAALLPGPGIAWQGVDADTARVEVRRGALSQSVEIRVAADGQPLWVRFERWSDANPEKTYRYQSFGGDLSEFRDFSGFRLPTRVEGGNFFGTEDYFPFYRAEVGDIRFPPAP